MASIMIKVAMHLSLRLNDHNRIKPKKRYGPPSKISNGEHNDRSSNTLKPRLNKQGYIKPYKIKWSWPNQILEKWV